MAYTSSAKIHNKLYHTITEFVPTTFNMDDDYSHNKLETTNSLNPGSISWSRYIKPSNLCSASQKVAHITIGLTSKNTANKVEVFTVLHIFHAESDQTPLGPQTVLGLY